MSNSFDEYLNEHGIVPELREPHLTVPTIGFSEKEQKWYGWSHRAIYGFGIGSTVKKGDIGYVADTPEGLIEQHVDFFADISEECAKQAFDECQILDDRSGIRILHTPLIVPMASSIEEALEAFDSDTSELKQVDLKQIDLNPGYTIVKCGRGEWTAKTLEDAKEMACDFAKEIA